MNNKVQEIRQRIEDWARYRLGHSQIARDCMSLMSELDAANKQRDIWKATCKAWEDGDGVKILVAEIAMHKERIESLQQENERLKEYEHDLENHCDKVHDEIVNQVNFQYKNEVESLQQRLQKAIEALDWVKWQSQERHVVQKVVSILREQSSPPYMAHGSLGSLLKREANKPDTAAVKGPLSRAYKFGSLHYKLAYHAFNVLESVLQDGKDEVLAAEFGVTVGALHTALEELYTDNADPDAEEDAH